MEFFLTEGNKQNNHHSIFKIDIGKSQNQSLKVLICAKKIKHHGSRILLEQLNNHHHHSPPPYIKIPDRLGESSIGLEGEKPDIVLSESPNPCEEHQTF